jgi:hypothetical protein
MKRKIFNDPDMMVGILRRRRPVLTAWLLFWAVVAVWCALGGFLLAELIYGAFAALALAGMYFLRIVRVNKLLEELE